MWGFVAISAGEKWSICWANGVVEPVEGPKVIFVWRAVLSKLQRVCASNVEYLRVQYASGQVEIVQGPVAVFVDPTVHQDVQVSGAISLTDHEILVVYRESAQRGPDDDSRVVQRHLVKGPCLYIPKHAIEWVQEFCWHGSTSDDPEKNGRKVKGAAKFKKLRSCPEQTYIDVESVRTRDDAVIRVKVMLFYRLNDVELMLSETHDPIADFVNALSSDVIEFVGAKSFEDFKSSTDKLNELGTYEQLTSRASSIGFQVTKVVFRGYGAPAQLQKMHDDAIERRTKLILNKEGEEQEQDVQDTRLKREQERLRTRRQMDAETKRHDLELQHEAKAHSLEMQRLAHEAHMHEHKETHKAHVEHLAALKRELSLAPEQLAQYMIAKEHGKPDRLIQITGEGSDSRASSFIQLQVEAM